MTTLRIIRHAQAEGNARGILMGSSKEFDFPLSAVGAAAARQKGDELKSQNFQPKRIYCSEFRRTQETAECIRETLGSDVPIVKHPALNERSFGRYEGLPYAAVLAAFEKEGSNPATIEPVDAFIARVLKGFEAIRSEALGDVLVVTHSNPLAVIRCQLHHPESLTRFWEFEDDGYLDGLTIEEV